MSKLPAANWPGFTMTLDREIGVGSAGRVVKERFDGIRKAKRKRHRYGALLSMASELKGESVRAACNDRFGRFWTLVARVSFQSSRATLSGSMPAAFHQVRSSLAR